MSKKSTQRSNQDDNNALLGALKSENIRDIFAESGDIVCRRFFIKNNPSFEIKIIYVDGLSDIKIINDNIICPLSTSVWYERCTTLSDAYNLSLNGALDASGISETEHIQEAVNAMLTGKTILVFDKLERAIIVDTIGFEKRSIVPATEESTYRSGKDSFVETLRVNTAMLRKKIKSPHLALEETVVGKQSQTRVCIAYLKNICNDDFIRIVKERISRINQDKVMSIRDIYTNVLKEKYTPFPTGITTEKADSCCMSLMDGKIALIVDELPYALLLPAVFGDFLQSPSDYGENFFVSSLFRILRLLCFILAIITPGFYVAVVLFHPDMIPYKLSISVAASRLGTPFSIFIEVLVMTVAFFVLIQASLQISKAIGGAISIVGGLVLGEAAIIAGLVSPAVIVVVAAASICSVSIPNKEVNPAIWLYQLLCTLLCAILGLVGLIFGLLLLLFCLAKLEPLGVPYLSPYTSKGKLQLDDSFIQFPSSLIKKRPEYLHPKNIRRKK